MKTIAYEYVTDYEIMYTMLTAMGYKITNVDHWQYTFANASGNEIILKRMHGVTVDPMVDLVMAILEEATHARISLDNGRTYCDPAEALAVYTINELAVYMDDDAREAVHREGVWDTELLFLLRYLSLAPHDLIIP